MSMFELDATPHQNPTPNDDVQPDSTPKSNMHGPGYEESTEAAKGQKRRRLRKGIPSRFTRKSNVEEKSKKALDEGSTGDDEDVVFVGEKAGLGRKRTRASVAAAKEAVNENTEIDLEELEKSAEKKKAAKKGKGKVTVPPVITADKTSAGPSTTPGSSDDVFVDVEEGIDEDLGAKES
ncbi:hypothetical protein LIER_18697 [Lithospermum erythrorhizon]|uniref:Uncharacterized protein n=1 Tax=Lithospermum erythrorhizon TaxID=34254 RepID=A0AAV3QEY6_LITER